MPAHVEHRRSTRAPYVGPFIVPASRLAELATLAADTVVDRLDIALTFSGGPDTVAETFARAACLDHIRVKAVEVAIQAGLTVPAAVSTLTAEVPESVLAFVEVPRDERRGELIAALADTDLRAKFRTGGVTADAYPDEPELAETIHLTVAHGLPFKATAGLHHAVRNTDAATGFEQHGFLNIIAAAEIGFVVGTGSPLGQPISVNDFAAHVLGVVFVNDWSARDIQAWQYVPLVPFLGKSFATSISAWVVPLLALESARIPGPQRDPQPLPYLREAESWSLSVRWNGHEVSRPPYGQMYWSPAQMLAHTTVNGASARTGDLLASGTVSGPHRDQRGAFIELTWGGTEPVVVGDEKRTFLEDGDEVVITATAPGPNGTRIGLGEVAGRITAAVERPR